ncbi:MAG: hypothetical protein OEL66_08785 [Desulfobulbaceae bacterium]|nr:hypothetical protein [Desulfobulbaceae bacterium]
MLYTAADVQDYHDLFSSADHEISIFTGKHDIEYADDFIIAACNFASRPENTLHIACQCGKDMAQCQILNAILMAPERRGMVVLYNAHKFRGKPYFILADESAYRIEIPEFAETILDYDDQEETARLHTVFNQIISSSSGKSYPPSPLKAN